MTGPSSIIAFMTYDEFLGASLVWIKHRKIGV